MNGIRKLLFGILISGLLGSLALAMDVSADGHIDAGRLVEEDTLLHLGSFTDQVRADGYDRVLAARLESERGRYVYEIEALNPEGRVREYFFDAKTGRLLRES